MRFKIYTPYKQWRKLDYTLYRPTGWAKKVNPKCSTHNFVKYWPILKVLSPLQSPENLHLSGGRGRLSGHLSSSSPAAHHHVTLMMICSLRSWRFVQVVSVRDRAHSSAWTRRPVWPRYWHRRRIQQRLRYRLVPGCVNSSSQDSDQRPLYTSTTRWFNASDVL